MSGHPAGLGAEDKVQLSEQEQKLARERSWALLREIIRPQRFILWGSIATVLIATLAATVQPLILAQALDTAVTPLLEGNSAPLTQLVLLFSAMVLISALLTWLNIILTAKISLRVLIYLRTRLFSHAQKLSVSFHEEYTSGKVISRLTGDVDAVRALLDSGISQLAATLLSMLFSAITIFVLDWRIGVLMLVMSVPIYLLSRWFQRAAVPIFRAQRVESAKLTSRFNETFGGIRAVKAFGSQSAARTSYGQAAEDYRVPVMDSVKYFGVFSPGLMLIGNFFIAAALVIGGYAVMGGSMQVGTLLALVIYAGRVFEPVMVLSEFYNLIQMAFSALEKISGFLAQKPAVEQAEHPVERDARAELVPGVKRGEIELQAVEFSYFEGHPAFMRTDVVIEPGSQVALVGPTGAGKSTLVKLMARFYDVSAGRLLLDGVDVRELSDEQLRREVIMLTQEVFLFSASVADNIRLGNPQASDEQVRAAAAAVGADEFIRRLPEGYETMLGQGGANLSAGQRQLVTFARVFLADPNVVILDEATASLDIPSEKAVQRALATLLEGRTSVVIAHRLSTVVNSDRVLVIAEGSIVEDGSPQELIAAGGRFADLYNAWEQLNGPESEG